jgi:hypothetical protein
MEWVRTQDVLGAGGADDDLGAHGGDADLHAGVAVLRELPGQHLIQLREEHPIRHELRATEQMRGQTSNSLGQASRARDLGEGGGLRDIPSASCLICVGVAIGERWREAGGGGHKRGRIEP